MNTGLQAMPPWSVILWSKHICLSCPWIVVSSICQLRQISKIYEQYLQCLLENERGCNLLYFCSTQQLGKHTCKKVCIIPLNHFSFGKRQIKKWLNSISNTSLSQKLTATKVCCKCKWNKPRANVKMMGTMDILFFKIEKEKRVTKSKQNK